MRAYERPRNPDVELDIIIVQHNLSDMTIQALESIDEDMAFRVVFVDNGSTMDDFLKVEEFLDAWPPAAANHLVYPAPLNYGFSKAFNIGLALSEAPYVAILNNDVILRKNTLTRLAHACVEHDLIAAYPISTSGNQRGTENPQDYRVRILDPMNPAEHMAYFCAVFTRRCIEDVGYIPEIYGMGMGEDDDHQILIGKAGYQQALVFGAFCEHRHRATWKTTRTEAERRQMHEYAVTLPVQTPTMQVIEPRVRITSRTTGKDLHVIHGSS